MPSFENVIYYFINFIYIPYIFIVYYLLLYQQMHMYKVRINYRRILQNYIFTNTEQKYMMLLPFERGMFAVS